MSIHWGISVATARVALAVSLAEAKNYARVNTAFTADDSWFTTIGIPSASNYVETATARALAKTVYLMTLDRFPFPSNYDRALYSQDQFIPIGPTNAPFYDQFAIRLQRNPVQAVNFVKYIDVDGTLQTMDSSLYTLDNNSLRARLLPAFPAGGLGGGWPIAQYVANAVQVQFTAGYGTTDATLVPPELKAAILLHVSMQYEIKGGADPAKARAMLETVDSLIGPYEIKNQGQV